MLYFPVKTLIKQVVQNSIKEKKIGNDDLSIIVFNVNDLKSNRYDFIWIEVDKEFKFNGKMYDVRYMKVKNDSIYYTCYFDHKENILEEIFTLQFNDHNTDKTQNNIQRIVLIGLFSEEIKNFNTNPINPNTTNIPLRKTEAGLLNNVTDVPTPPPRNIV